MNDKQIKKFSIPALFVLHVISLTFVLNFFNITSFLDIIILMIIQFCCVIIGCWIVVSSRYYLIHADQKYQLQQYDRQFYEQKIVSTTNSIGLFKNIFLLCIILPILTFMFGDNILINNNWFIFSVVGVFIVCLVSPVYFYIPLLLIFKLFFFSEETIESDSEQKEIKQEEPISIEVISPAIPESLIETPTQGSKYQAKSTYHPKPKFPPFPPILMHRKKLLDDAVLLSAKHSRLIKQYVEVLDYVEDSIQRVQQQEDKNFIMQTEQETFLRLQNAIAEYLSYSPEERLRYQANRKRIPDLWLSQYIEQQRQSLIIATEKIYHNDVQSLLDHQSFLKEKFKTEQAFTVIKK